MNIIATTPRIYIREFSQGELGLLLDIDADERLTRYVKKRTPDETKKIFKETIEDYQNGALLGRWGIFNVADNDFIGLCILKTSDYDAQKTELGYRLHLKYWGNGIATELAAALVNYGFKTAGINELCAVTDPANIASQKVLIKAGFKRDGFVFWYGEELPFFIIKKQEDKA
jgi:ribosomal-protein-alanine N-acetyltransferase|eukprot:gene10613-10683_t